MKNEKFFLDIQTKRSDIANQILNAAIDAEQTVKCKWPYNTVIARYLKKKRQSDNEIWSVNKI